MDDLEEEACAREARAKAAYEACIARQEDPSIHPPWEQLGEETQKWWITGKCPDLSKG